MVLLELTGELRDRLDALSPHLPLELRQRVATYLVPTHPDHPHQQPTRRGDAARSQSAGTVPHPLLVDVSAWAKSHGDPEQRDNYRLASLLRLTDIYAPPLPERVRSPELLAILADIQLRQDRVAYSSMTSLAPAPHPSLIPLHDPHDDPAHTGGRTKSVAEEWAEIRRELGAIVNVGASMLAVGTAVWWVGGGRSYAARLCLALAGAVAIAAIEGFLYYRFFTALSAKKAREAAYPPTLSISKNRAVLSSGPLKERGKTGMRARQGIGAPKTD